MDTTDRNDDEPGTTKDVTKALFKEFGGHKAVAHEFDISLTRIYCFADPAFPEHNISFKRVAQLTSPKATAAARYLAREAGGVFFPLTLRANESPVSLIGSSARSHANAIAESLESLADGVVSGMEKTAIMREIDEAIADLASLRGALVAMADEEG
jgi:hypothetical protein